MKRIATCRRTVVALVAIAALTVLGLEKGQDVSLAIASVAAALAGANAYQKKGNPDDPV